MTLTKYAPSYPLFTFTELKRSLQNRGIAPPYGDRKKMMRTLREADRDATFRFLDLPPELRNLTYDELLTLRCGGDKFSAKHCYPAILATSKEVFEEADGLLNDESEAEVSVELWRRESPNVELGFRIYLKGAALTIDSSQPANHAQVEWPELLRRVRTIKLNINLQSATRPGSGLVEPEGRDIQVNHSLNGLYTFLNGKCKAKNLEVEVSSDLTSPERRVRRIISPICGLAGRMETASFKFTNLSTPVAEELEGASAFYRILFSLEDDVKLAREINRRVHHFSAFDLELYAQCLHAQFDFQYDQLHIWRDSGTVEEIIQEVEDAIEQAVNEDTEDLSGEMSDAVKLLKENQRRRKMAAKQNNSNQK